MVLIPMPTTAGRDWEGEDWGKSGGQGVQDVNLS